MNELIKIIFRIYAIIEPMVLEIILAVGVTSVLAAFIYIGRKLQILDTLQTTTDKIKCNVNVISNYLIKNAENFNPSELQTFSPFQLTPNGTEFIKKIGFDNIFNQNKEDFFKYIESEKPKLKYDVEIASIKSISALYEKEYMNFLKVFFYNNPGRNLGNTAPTLGIYVRDNYLSEHPEITE